MSSEWRKTTFAELIGQGTLEIGDGYRAKNDELGGNGIIFLRAGHVKDTHIDFLNADRFEHETIAKFKGKIAQPGDVVVTTKGNSTGRVAIVTSEMPRFVYSPHLSYWRSTREASLAQGFLRAWSRSPAFIVQLRAMSRSTDMAPYLSLTDQRYLTLTLPPPNLQHAIAVFFDAIESRLGLLREINATLEAIAQALFRSWFVDFDPVRAKAEGREPEGLDIETVGLFPNRLEESQLGLIPAGWACVPFSTTIKVIGGGTPKTSIPEYWGGDIPWFSVVDAPASSDVFVLDTEKHITNLGLENSSTKILPEGATIISARGTVGRLALVGCEMAMNQSCYGLRGVAGDSYFTYFSTYRLVEALKQRSHGSVFDTITTQTLAGVSLVYPPTEVIRAFENLIEAAMLRIKENVRIAQTLSRLRDSLLPKLISGQLRLPEVEALLQDAA